MVSVNALSWLPFVFVALTVKADAHGVVGVPLISPVVGFKPSPAGKLPLTMLHVGVGLPVHAKVAV